MLVEAAPKETHGGIELPVPVDEEKAANVLEATAGNVALAVSLYWDDYFASRHHLDPVLQADQAAAAAAPEAAAAEEDQKPPARRRKFRRRSETNNNNNDGNDDDLAPVQGEQQDEDDALVDTDESSDEEQKNERQRLARAMANHRSKDCLLSVSVSRRLRRSLDPDFRAADRPNRQRQDPEGEYDGDHGRHASHADELAPRAGEVFGNNNDNQARNGRNEVFHLIGEKGAESSLNISSEDEVPQWGRLGGAGHGRRNAAAVRHEAAMKQRIKQAAEEISKKVLKHIGAPEEETHSRSDGGKRPDDNFDDDEDPDDWIDDRDWLDDEGVSAIDSLWGNGGQDSSSGTVGDENANNGAGVGGQENNDNGANNIIDLEDDDDGSVGGEGTENAGIPHTWLNAGFHLSDCGTGLVVKMPNVEDIEFLAWRQQHDVSRRNEAPPPFHCRGLTSILSIVTALMYSGAALQGTVVNCESGKKPWAALTLEEKKREFDGRLADALTSLIYIAATSSIERKRKALQKQQKKMNVSPLNVSEEDRAKEKKMQARLNLVPTCVWEEDLAISLVPRGPDGPAYRRVPVKTSWTNIKDVKLYVMSSLRSFTTKGGVALLLETLLRIHGSHWTSRQIRKARSQQPPELKDETASSGVKKRSRCLIRCTCEDRQKKILGGKPLNAKIRNDPEQLIKLLTPCGNECVSVELLSLILTGNVASNWKDCSVNGLGIGLMTENVGEVSYSLARPNRPVWILRGETCYSVAFIREGTEIDSKTISKLDKPMSSLHFCHWNGWYGETDKTEFRVVIGVAREPSPLSMKKRKLDEVERELKFQTEKRKQVKLERKRRQLIDAVSIEQQDFVVKNELKYKIHPEELQSLKIHPEDQKLFPKKRQMWRYDMDQDENVEASKKRPTAIWVPYHRLSERQKRIVEIQLGPKINKILWTRWPTAAVDSFTNDPVV
jgi:hypothetical protein